MGCAAHRRRTVSAVLPHGSPATARTSGAQSARSPRSSKSSMAAGPSCAGGVSCEQSRWRWITIVVLHGMPFQRARPRLPGDTRPAPRPSPASGKEAAVVPEIDLRKVVRRRLGQLLRHLSGDAPSTRPALVDVVVVHLDHGRWRVRAEAVGEGRKVEVVASGVALENEPADRRWLCWPPLGERSPPSSIRAGHGRPAARGRLAAAASARVPPGDWNAGQPPSRRLPPIGRYLPSIGC